MYSETDPLTASQILRSVRQALAKSPFMFKDNYARIISGEEEGISSWITVNYLNGALNYSLVRDYVYNTIEGSFITLAVW